MVEERERELEDMYEKAMDLNKQDQEIGSGVEGAVAVENEVTVFSKKSRMA